MKLDYIYEIVKHAIHRFGKKNQLLQCCEEISELIIEMDEYNNGNSTKKHLITEIGDVYVMLYQIQLIFNIDTEAGTYAFYSDNKHIFIKLISSINHYDRKKIDRKELQYDITSAFHALKDIKRTYDIDDASIYTSIDKSIEKLDNKLNRKTSPKIKNSKKSIFFPTYFIILYTLGYEKHTANYIYENTSICTLPPIYKNLSYLYNNNFVNHECSKENKAKQLWYINSQKSKEIIIALNKIAKYTDMKSIIENKIISVSTKNPNWFYFIAYLNENDYNEYKSLKKILDVKRDTTNRIINSLIYHDVIKERKYGRKNYIYLTEKGKYIKTHIETIVNQLE